MDSFVRSNHSSRNFKILNFGENNGLFVVKMVKFTENASPSIVTGFQFGLIHFVDPITARNSSSQNLKIFDFGENMDFLG